MVPFFLLESKLILEAWPLLWLSFLNHNQLFCGFGRTRTGVMNFGKKCSSGCGTRIATGRTISPLRGRRRTDGTSRMGWPPPPPRSSLVRSARSENYYTKTVSSWAEVHR